MLPKLDQDALLAEAAAFSRSHSGQPEANLYGVTDGKAVGTYLEHKFQEHLSAKYSYIRGSSASGIDFPDLSIDIKVTSVRQPQSSCPFKSARQKIYGLGYSLLVFVYEKFDDQKAQLGRLDLRHTVFVTAERTADYQTTSGLLKILQNDANKDDIIAFLHERLLPADDLECDRLAEEVISNHPSLGYLTISNALQWRLQYSRVIEKAGSIKGLLRVV